MHLIVNAGLTALLFGHCCDTPRYPPSSLPIHCNNICIRAALYRGTPSTEAPPLKMHRVRAACTCPILRFGTLKHFRRIRKANISVFDITPVLLVHSHFVEPWQYGRIDCNNVQRITRRAAKTHSSRLQAFVFPTSTVLV